MAPPHETLVRGLLRAWRAFHAAPGTGVAPRHWAPPRGPSLLKGNHHRPARHGPQSYASQTSGKGLASPFLALLRAHVDPAMRGALQVLRHTRPTHNNILTPQFRRAAASAHTAIARASKRPTVDVCQFGHHHELGLQTARRHFSQSTVQTAQQAVLGLRLAADEARENLFHEKYHKSSKSTPRLSSKRQRTMPRSQCLKVDTSRISMTAPKSPLVPGADAFHDQMDLYFPEPSTAARGVQEFAAELIVPLDPDLSNIWDLSSSYSQPSTSSAWPKQGPLYDGALGTATSNTSSAYEIHLQKTRQLQQVLQDLCACVLPCGRELAHAPHAVHGVGYKIVVPGFTADQLREILIDRLGLEQGLWFGKLLRDVPSSSEALCTGRPGHCPQSSPGCADSADFTSPQLLHSPPMDDWDCASLSSSWDGMLHEPPQECMPGLEFSSFFIESLDESRYPSYAKSSHFGLYPSHDDDSSLYLQDSR